MDRTILDNDRKGASLKPSSSSLLPNDAAEAEATSVFHQQMLPFFFLEHLLLQGGSKLRVNVYFPRSNRLFIFGSKKLRDLLKNPVLGTILPGLWESMSI